VRIDLHIHSNASDGALPPAELVDAAVAGGLDLIALADHDTAAGVHPAMAAARDRIHVLPAIEISTTHRAIDLHVLGYDIDPEHPDILAFAETARVRREERIRAMLGRLEGLGVDLALDDVHDMAGDARALARPHLARAMLEHGAVGSLAEAFDRFIGDGKPAFLATQLPPPREAFDLVHNAGGLAVWAHPPADLLERELVDFVRHGLDGIECHRPRLTREETRRAVRHARRNDLLITGGSDWHGPWNGELGAFHLEPGDIEAFLDCLGI